MTFSSLRDSTRIAGHRGCVAGLATRRRWLCRSRTCRRRTAAGSSWAAPVYRVQIECERAAVDQAVDVDRRDRLRHGVERQIVIDELAEESDAGGVPLGFAIASSSNIPCASSVSCSFVCWLSGASFEIPPGTSAQSLTGLAPPPPGCAPGHHRPHAPASRPGPADCWRRTDSGPLMPEPLTQRRIRRSAVPGH